MTGTETEVTGSITKMGGQNIGQNEETKSDHIIQNNLKCISHFLSEYMILRRVNATLNETDREAHAKNIPFCPTETLFSNGLLSAITVCTRRLNRA